jgi:HEAT repeat protein
MLLGAVDHEPAAPRLLVQLAFPRIEVRVAAAVALRRLAIPHALEPMLQYVTRAADWQVDPEAAAASDPLIGLALQNKFDLDEQMAQLLQAFGQMGYRQAEPLMRRHVPKTTPVARRVAPQARAAAIWALGLLHLDQPDEPLAAQLASRLSDMDMTDAEAIEVKRMAAVALGRMRADSQLDTLRHWYDVMKTGVDLGGATRWAIMRITGEDLPPLGPARREESVFSLRPSYQVDDDAYLEVR